MIAQEKKVNRKAARKHRRSEISTLSESLKDVKLNETSNVDVKCEPVAALEVLQQTFVCIQNKEFFFGNLVKSHDCLLSVEQGVE